MASGRISDPPYSSPLPVKHAAEAVGELLVLSEEEADLAAADADVAGGHVGIGTDVAEQLRHERLAEPHDLKVALALGIEVAAALAAAHHDRGETVLEDLLEGKELQQAEIDGGMEAQTALVGADGAVHLDAEAAIHLDFAAVVDPRNTEDDDALRLHNPIEDLGLAVGGRAFDGRHDRFGDFLNRLQELGLAGVLGGQLFHKHAN